MSRSYAANTAATKKPMEGMGSSANSVSISHSNIGEIKTIAKDESAERDSAGGYARTSPDADRRQVSVDLKGRRPTINGIVCVGFNSDTESEGEEEEVQRPSAGDDSENENSHNVNRNNSPQQEEIKSTNISSPMVDLLDFGAVEEESQPVAVVEQPPVVQQVNQSMNLLDL